MLNFTRSCLLCITALLISCSKDNSGNAIRTETWMQDLIRLYPSKTITLQDILLPGVHDAGMYELNSCTFGANSCNTQTQKLRFSDQLVQGMRIFDVRPSFAYGKFYTEHSTGCGGLGCKGGYLADIYTDISRFLDNHAELVILELSHFCGTSAGDTALLNLADRLLGDKIYKESGNSSVPIFKKPLKEIIGNSGKGKVLMIYEGVSDNLPNKAQGLYASDELPGEGAWTNSHDLKDMLDGQLREYRDFSNDGEHLFSFSWQVTLDELQSVNCAINPNAASIRTETDSAHAVLPAVFDSLIRVQQIRKGRIPNILYMDFSDINMARQCIRISQLNLE